jgi:hypothetical protein
LIQGTSFRTFGVQVSTLCRELSLVDPRLDPFVDLDDGALAKPVDATAVMSSRGG